ncbi:MAG: hypothetical protein ACRCW9_09720 [Cetobacterium sp.]
MFEIRVESEGFSWKIVETKITIEHKDQLIIDLIQEDGDGYEENVDLNLDDEKEFENIMKNVKNKIDSFIENNVSLSLQEFYNEINPLFLNIKWPLEED